MEISRLVNIPCPALSTQPPDVTERALSSSTLPRVDEMVVLKKPRLANQIQNAPILKSSASTLGNAAWFSSFIPQNASTVTQTDVNNLVPRPYPEIAMTMLETPITENDHILSELGFEDLPTPRHFGQVVVESRVRISRSYAYELPDVEVCHQTAFHYLTRIVDGLSPFYKHPRFIFPIFVHCLVLAYKWNVDDLIKAKDFCKILYPQTFHTIPFVAGMDVEWAVFKMLGMSLACRKLDIWAF